MWIVAYALFYVLYSLSVNAASSDDLLNLGFPVAWDGDKFQKEPCSSQNIPTWLDGYFLIQMAASYGNQSNAFGQKLVHLFDGLGGISSFELSKGQVKYSARYYPSRSYKIWDFYERDVSQCKVAWMTWDTPYNATAYEIWKNIPLYANDPMFQTHPNIDFWRIGHRIVGATENTDIGMEFNVSTLTDFKHPSLNETSDIFRHQSTIIPLTMAVHERKNQSDIIYAVNSAFDPTKQKTYQIVFKVTPDGTRTVEGTFEQGTYDLSKCLPNGTYSGDKRILPNYMHSITSTKQYVVLPLTSIVFNPCKISDNYKPDVSSGLPPGVKRGVSPVEFSADVPMKFLVFNKQTKTFVTDKPIEVDVALTPAHQFNAYEDDDGTLVVDLGCTDGENGAMYDLLTLDSLLHGTGKVFRLLRFRIDLKTKKATYKNILQDQNYVDGEFPNVNPNYMEKKYKWGYMMTGFLKPGAKISKIDMDQAKIVAEFAATGNKAASTIFREPWFVPRPGATGEDDGVVIVLGSDTKSRLSTLYIVDAKSMTLLGQAEAPTFVPLGLHNRFFFKTELGMASSNDNFDGSRRNDNSDSTGVTWGGLLEQTRDVFCSLFKEVLDKTGINFCK